MNIVGGIYVLLGSNLGDRNQNLRLAREFIDREAGHIREASSVYETEAWGVLDQPLFYNQVLKVETTLGHELLLKTLQRIEQRIGKVKVGKWRERLIDIDLLYYNNRLVRTPLLTLPHPEIQHRRFTLAPLVELAPDENHPLLLRSHRELLEITTDQLEVWKVGDGRSKAEV